MRPIKPKPCVLKGLPRNAAPRPRAKKQPKNTKKGNPKRPKSFSGDSDLCLRQLLALPGKSTTRAHHPLRLLVAARKETAKGPGGSAEKD